MELSMESTTLSLPCLVNLDIEDCPNLNGWWRGCDAEASNEQFPCFPCHSYLIKGCPNLASMPLFSSVRNLAFWNIRWKPPMQPTTKLKRAISKLAPSSSSIFPPFFKLETLWLSYIEDLESFSEEFLQNLISLRNLGINGCVNLKSMPNGV
ncbi:hypothetical protein CXB51_026085 [Gossypium anomalum]|uniref:Uncharacterized protein n=1 Tax=Gossypium anomalum TaxID=47600 RepID=A0A8J6CNB2_9ROSI|nr:hypothetical protein CXB51_026085 [Gossypium anomalum]